MTEANLPYPFLLPAARALALFTAAAFATSWLISGLLFVLPVFRIVGAFTVSPRASAYDNAAANFAYNRADPRSADSLDAVIGALLLSSLAWVALGIASRILLVDPYIPQKDAMRMVVIVAGFAITYAAHRFLFMLLARMLSPEDLATVRVKWKAIQRRSD